MKKVLFFLSLLIVSLQFYLAKCDNHDTQNYKTISIEVATLQTKNNLQNSIQISEVSNVISIAESTVTNSTQSQTSSFNGLPKFSQILGASNVFIASTIKQYSLNWENRLIRNRKKDIIFPFHYFM